MIEDNGIGIQAEDLPRVFEKGLPDIMEEQIRSLPGLDCIFAKRSWIRWDIRYGLIQRWEKEPVYIWN